MILYLLIPLIIEAICEVITESYFFEPVRNFIIEKSEVLGVLISCGYCMSFWIAMPFALFFPIGLFTPTIDVVFSWLIYQRASNIYHHIITRIRK